eukprot:376601-Hanusia_phi.AAC.1
MPAPLTRTGEPGGGSELRKAKGRAAAALEAKGLGAGPWLPGLVIAGLTVQPRRELRRFSGLSERSVSDLEPRSHLSDRTRRFFNIGLREA